MWRSKALQLPRVGQVRAEEKKTEEESGTGVAFKNRYPLAL